MRYAHRELYRVLPVAAGVTILGMEGFEAQLVLFVRITEPRQSLIPPRSDEVITYTQGVVQSGGGGRGGSGEWRVRAQPYKSNR